MSNHKAHVDRRPNAYGYGRGEDITKQRQAVGGKCAREQWILRDFYVEQFVDEPFMSREMGRRLLMEILQPGDYLVIQKYTRAFNCQHDCRAVVSFLRQKEVNLFIHDSSHISPEYEDEKVWKFIKRMHQNKSAELSAFRRQARPPVGWKRAGFKVVPFIEERQAALEVVRMRDEEEKSWEHILLHNTNTQFWPTTPFSRARAEAAYEAAKNRFPGVDGEIVESVEGTGL